MGKKIRFVLLSCLVFLIQLKSYAQKDNPPLPQPEGTPPPGLPIGTSYQLNVLLILGIILAFIIFTKIRRYNLNFKNT